MARGAELHPTTPEGLPVMPHLHPANQAFYDERSRGGRAADSVTGFLGSWRFIAVQTVVVAAWVVLNIVGVAAHWDAYPFILLNLAFSLQAAYTGPLVLLSSNRAAVHDRARAEHAYTATDRTLAELEALRVDHRNTGEALTLLTEGLIEEFAALRELVKAKPAAPRRRAAAKSG